MILIRAQEKKLSGKGAGTQLELRRSHGKMPQESSGGEQWKELSMQTSLTFVLPPLGPTWSREFGE